MLGARLAEEYTLTQSHPPHAGYGPAEHYQPQPRNGFGITALVVGLLAICLGFIPLFGLGAIMGGIIAVIFGLLGFTRARRGIATNKKMSLFGTVAGVIAGALGIWGLVIVGNAFTQLDNTIKGAAPSAAAPEAPGAPADASTPEESTTGAFGQNITWPDGVAVTVSEPKAYRPSSSAATDQAAARYVSMTVTVTNGSDKNIEATGTTLAATANGTPADQVFDSAKGIGGSPSSTVLPRKSITYTVAFGLPAKEQVDLQVEVRPSFGLGYQPAIFTGQI
jgi:hypothetical protein